ncbi:50S ribosomal protein L3 [Candidatus Babeliales bacterium]|nr:50S ribosomal protein L3 [Candidatus Babeliales bacterium]
MLSRIFGKKMGMTQIFIQDGKVIPVTVIDIANLFVTQIKTMQKDGYSALQLGLLRNRYNKLPFDINWCKNKKKYFLHLKELKINEDELEKVKIGHKITLENVDIEKEVIVKVTSNSKGLGFQGVVKRWGFSGGPSSHGSNFHRIPGSIGTICSQGKVYKGKKMPGQCGSKQITIKGLKIIELDKKGGYLYVNGAVPGKKNSLVVISK